jgi:predicted amidophosphoribosyltransferase
MSKIPTADVVEVKHGHWGLIDECANEGVYCSVCHKKVYKTYYANQKLKSKFCPNCGAKMDGGKAE